MELSSIVYRIVLFLLIATTVFAILPPSGRWRPLIFAKDKKRFVGVGLLFIKDNTILLVYRDKSEINYNKHGLVGGLAEKWESVEDAAIREAHEEVGVVIKKGDLQLVHCMSSQENGTEVVGFYFVVKNWTGEPYNAVPDTHQYIGWFPVDQLPANLIERNRIAIESMKKGIFYSEYGYK